MRSLTSSASIRVARLEEDRAVPKLRIPELEVTLAQTNQASVPKIYSHIVLLHQ
jgi:hypothetical protein